MKIKEGERLPESEFFYLDDNNAVQIVDTSTLLKGHKAIMFAVPGAFTKVCSAKHLPGYVKNTQQILDKGIDKIFCLAVNDPYVMNAWSEANNIGDNIIMLSDPYLSFTKLIGAEVDRNSKGMGMRSSRYAMVIENLQVQNIQEEEETKNCVISLAEEILEII